MGPRFETSIIVVTAVNVLYPGPISLFSERNGLTLKQGEWNILQIGTKKYLTNCKRLRFKNIYLETDNQKTIPLMTEQTIDVSYR